MSGGIWVLWRSNTNITVRRTHPQFILLTFKEAHTGNHSLAVVYGSPSKDLRQRLWKELGRNKGYFNHPWAAIGDFNSVTCKEEVSNFNTYSDQRSRNFNDWINEEALIDLGYTGQKFTWVRGNNTNTFKGARLDRGLCSVDWLDCFPDSTITHLPAMSSDHTPIVLNTSTPGSKKVNRRFQFQVAWTAHDDFLNTIDRTWKKGGIVKENVVAVKEALIDWNRNTFGNIHKNIRRLEARLEGIQRIRSIKKNNGLIKLEGKIRKNLEEALYLEELMWYQNSREEWIKSGDRNTKFYHAATKVRKATSKIHCLRNDHGDWVDKEDNLASMVQNHFQSMFKDDKSMPKVSNISNGFPFSANIFEYSFCREVTKEEIKKALFDMEPFKAPGPDGFHASFYQSTWELVGDDISKMVKVFIESGELQEGMNDTLLTLIPKISNPETVGHLRPISLCNVGYKIITKVISNRLKDLMNIIIGPEQSSFVPKRQITDNIAIFQETLHSMRKKKGNKGFMLLKIDLEKAYDRLSWSFIQETIQLIGLEERWVNIIMTCITTPRLAVLWNGAQLDWIKPERGIRQGDPMSPYMFVLCIERLSHLIKEEAKRGNWKGIKLSRYGPELTHLLFADDMVLFADATEEQMRAMKSCLDRFEAVSGQRINLQKSQIYFSCNVLPEQINKIVKIAGIGNTTDLGRYLGVPAIHGRVNQSLYAPMLDRLDKKMDGWKNRYLSMAGRSILAQSCLSSIPYFAMQTAYLPMGLCDEIDKKIRKFIWGTGVHLVSWDTVTKAKHDGGLGIRKSRDMNIAFLAKAGWRLIKEKECLWAKVICAKYMGKEGDNHSLILKQGCSNFWRGICKAANVLNNGIRKSVRTGKDSYFWTDSWITEAPLEQQAMQNITDLMKEHKVKEYWIPHVG